ncbi:S8 family peptidase [Thermomonospora catenispora]|uniref:S8 family peptidase n=1 Tax=Thermomonospora catenispora TaxID=2493090 RepID=UPI0011227EDD|nr:S8/S53 family peptidase [Thermomonospora catenispora]TNY34661.1 peptidase S8 and S53 subtilisin kexin sedolisin [Thermomonospora catenispora]
MFDQQARLERMLARHGDAAVVEATAGRPTVIRRDQLLVAAEDAAVVEDRVRRWCDSMRDEGGVCLVRLRPGARVDVCDLASRLGGDGRRPAVAPNHLVHGQPMWWSGPADRPRPCAPLPAPSAAAPPRRDVTVAVLDTGLSPHPWYERADWYAEQRAEVAEVLDADLDLKLDAQAGHGTFIAGVVLRHAPSARIRARRVIGGDGVGDELAVVRALRWLAAWGRADVVNLSLGCHTFDDRPSPVLARAIAALGRGTVVVAAAGNAAARRPFWPAALPSVIAVAALDGRERAWFSNHGEWVDACAPGVRVTSCYLDLTRTPLRTSGRGTFAGYATWSGTSFAAPAVAGAIAALAAAEDLDAVAAAERVLDPAAARTLPDLGVVVGDRLPRLSRVPAPRASAVGIDPVAKR